MNYRYFGDVPYYRVHGDTHTFTHYFDSLDMDSCSFTVQKSRSLIRKKENRKMTEEQKSKKRSSVVSSGFVISAFRGKN